MIVIIPSLIWFAMALGLAIAFDSLHATWTRHRPAARPRDEAARVYWYVICLFVFVTSGNPLAVLSVAPVAISHVALIAAGAHRPNLRSILLNIAPSVSNLWRRMWS